MRSDSSQPAQGTSFGMRISRSRIAVNADMRVLGMCVCSTDRNMKTCRGGRHEVTRR